ncbi:MAG TPA: ArsR family transcriptional regulator [Candidatus Caldiarchaeum subterraneum]|uniref:ArsR family transcriptional regulator n=1 Tax=Caldiarchaeum subterraneum TaxID=311458 RepID=A0A833E9T0_CALS0|nr:ArsR family transcriptional regulator [Candidatus Caldarchaeum subterraneum]
MESIRRLFWWVLVGSKGGPTRMQILMLLRQGPANANQIAVKLNLNYKTVQHHLKVLEENRMIVPEGERYNVTYRLSPELLDNIDILDSIIESISSSKGVDKNLGAALDS